MGKSGFECESTGKVTLVEQSIFRLIDPFHLHFPTKYLHAHPAEGEVRVGASYTIRLQRTLRLRKVKQCP